MNYRIAVLSVFMGIVIGSFCIGFEKTDVKKPNSLDAKISDHDKIEKLMGEVAELQKQVATLKQTFETHTHSLRIPDVAKLPNLMECDQTVVGWASTGIHREPVQKVCRQRMSGSISVLVPGKEPAVTSPPLP
jgi:hypothetical protein